MSLHSGIAPISKVDYVIATMLGCGIDIDHNCVKLIELRKTRQGYFVENYAVGNIDDIAQLNAKSKISAIALPYAGVISKTIQLDASLHEKEIENYLLMNMQQYTGFMAQDISMDFSVHGPVKDCPDKIVVELTAARRKEVNARVNLFQRSYLKIKFVDVESFALQRAALLQLGNTDDAMVIINLKLRSLLFCVLQQGEIIYVTEENILDNQGVVERIRHELQMFFATHSLPITSILVGGESADKIGLIDEIAELVHIPVHIANPFINMEITKQLDSEEFYKIAHSMMISCGLAIQCITDG